MSQGLEFIKPPLLSHHRIQVVSFSLPKISFFPHFRRDSNMREHAQYTMLLSSSATAGDSSPPAGDSSPPKNFQELGFQKTQNGLNSTPHQTKTGSENTNN